MHAYTARRLTRRAQIAAGALFAGAGALVLMPVGAAEATAEDSILLPAAKGTGKSRPSDPLPDAGEIAAALEKVAPPVPKTEIVAKPDETKPDGNAATTSPKPSSAPWRYIGSITNANYRRAIIVLNEKQHLVAEGEKIEGATLTSIAADHLILRTGETDRRVDLAPKQAVTLQVVTATGAPRAPGGPRSPTDDEEYAAKLAKQREQEPTNPKEKHEAMMREAKRRPPPAAPGRAPEELGAESAGSGQEQPGKEDK